MATRGNLAWLEGGNQGGNSFGSRQSPASLPRILPTPTSQLAASRFASPNISTAQQEETSEPELAKARKLYSDL